MEDLFNVAGEQFFFDLDRISEFIKLEKQEDDGIDDIFKEKPDPMDPNETTAEDAAVMLDESMGQMIDITKWELTKAMIETVLSESGELDESMGVAKLEQQLSIPFRISFNTLLINSIIKKTKE